MEICELKEILKRQRITYEELAKRTNLSISTITKIFGGYAKYPRVDTIRAIEDALGVGKSQTVLEKEKPPAQLTDGEVALLEKFSRIPQEQRALFFDMLEVFLKNQK